jgi:hypothetical protein
MRKLCANNFAKKVLELIYVEELKVSAVLALQDTQAHFCFCVGIDVMQIVWILYKPLQQVNQF